MEISIVDEFGDLSLEQYLRQKIGSINNILALSPELLIQIYRRYWIWPKRAFCRDYKANLRNLSRFLIGKYRNRATIRAIQQWLVDSFNSKPSYSQIERSLPLEAFIAPAAEKLQVVIFIDGDQAVFQLSRLAWILPPKILANFYPVYFVITTSYAERNQPVAALQSIIERYPSLFNIYNASSSLKNAADTAIIVQVERCRTLPVQIPFWLVTNDHFAIPLLDCLEADGRTKSRIINRETSDLGLALLFSFFDLPISEQAANFRRSVLSQSLTTVDQLILPAHLTPTMLKAELEHIDLTELITPQEKRGSV